MEKLACVKIIHGSDVTDAYLQGAEITLALVKKHGIKIAILKECSPSCGSSEIDFSDFSEQKIIGEVLPRRFSNSMKFKYLMKPRLIKWQCT